MNNDNGCMPSAPMDNISAARAEEGYFDPFAYGLTKREAFAMNAQPPVELLIAALREAEGDFNVNDYITMAVAYKMKEADQLLAALEGEPNE